MGKIKGVLCGRLCGREGEVCWDGVGGRAVEGT